MKLKYALSMVLLAAASIAHRLFNPREECHNTASTTGTHANGIVPRIAEVTLSPRYILVGQGTADTGVIVNVAATRPIGVCLDEPTFDSSKTTKAAVAVLGCASGTLKMVANGAIAAGAPVYTAAAGKVSSTYGATYFLVGRALNAAAADLDIVEVAHCFPVINAVNTL